MEGLSLFEIELQQLPTAILNNIINSLYIYKGASKTTSHQSASERIKGINLFVKGKRNEDLWHVAYSLFKGKMYEEEVLQHLEIYGKACDPTWGSIIEDEPLEAIITSVLKYLNRKERNLWIEKVLGKFRYFSCRKKDKTIIKNYIARMTSLSKARIKKLISRKKKIG